MELDEIVKIVKKNIEIELSKNTKKIPIEGSGRHIHLSEEDAEYLFGSNYNFTKTKDLSQPGQFAVKERVRLIGPKGVIEGVVILGPFRNKTQVEISITDARSLGINPTIRESGDILNTPGIIVTNGDKMLSLKEGVIVAKNHIHMNEEEAKTFNVKDKELVDIQVLNSLRPIIFKDVLIRVNKNFSLAMHIDYDEANACALSKETFGVIYGK